MKEFTDYCNISEYINLDVPKETFPFFSEILQKGFYHKTKCIGNNIETLLKLELGLTNEYINNKIGTVFLDGKPVDDLKSVILRRYSKIALSAAMPGLVGAIMRQGSPFASMREDISQKSPESSVISEGGLIIIKLFNLVIDDIGEKLLKRGVIFKYSDLFDLFISKALLKKCSRILLNAQEVSSEVLLNDIKSNSADFISLTVNFRCIS